MNKPRRKSRSRARNWQSEATAESFEVLRCLPWQSCLIAAAVFYVVVSIGLAGFFDVQAEEAMRTKQMTAYAISQRAALGFERFGEVLAALGVFMAILKAIAPSAKSFANQSGLTWLARLFTRLGQ